MCFHAKDLDIYYLADSEISKLTIKMEGTVCYEKAEHFYVTRTVTDRGVCS